MTPRKRPIRRKGRCRRTSTSTCPKEGRRSQRAEAETEVTDTGSRAGDRTEASAEPKTPAEELLSLAPIQAPPSACVTFCGWQPNTVKTELAIFLGANKPSNNISTANKRKSAKHKSSRKSKPVGSSFNLLSTAGDFRSDAEKFENATINEHIEKYREMKLTQLNKKSFIMAPKLPIATLDISAAAGDLSKQLKLSVPHGNDSGILPRLPKLVER
nr:unnamed protein product [Spirometra erinaceieuropaei]